MVTLSDWVRAATERLATVSDTPRLDAELIAAHALGMERADMLLRLRDLVVPVAAEALLARRLAHEPVAYITGVRDFWTLRLRVTPDVLIPRPDSETLIEAAIAHFADGAKPTRILDLGTGSGALLLAALDQWPGATGLGVDASPAALAVAEENAHRCGLATRADFRAGDWATDVNETFDLILCNPPYIEESAELSPDVAWFEPAPALYAGADGLSDYRRIVPDLPRLLAPGGMAVLEIGSDQAGPVAGLVQAAGLVAHVHRDLAGRDRCIAATR